MSSDIRWYKRLYRLMMIMSPDRAAGVRVSLPDRRKMKPKETINLYRVISLLVIALVTLE